MLPCQEIYDWTLRAQNFDNDFYKKCILSRTKVIWISERKRREMKPTAIRYLNGT